VVAFSNSRLVFPKLSYPLILSGLNSVRTFYEM
jgi:hypothetical protein